MARASGQSRKLSSRGLHGLCCAMRSCVGRVAALSTEGVARDRKRRKKCGVPKEIRFQTRHELALAMLQEHGRLLPHQWIAGDDEMGRSTAFRRQLHALEELYLLAVPSNTSVRDLEGPWPPYAGRGPRPKQPFQRVDRWCSSLSESEWTRIDVRDSEKGPLVLEIVKRLRLRCGRT